MVCQPAEWFASASPGGGLVRPRYIELHTTQPSHEIPPVEQQMAAARRRERVWKDLRERLALQIEVSTSVTHRRVEARVT